MIALGNAQPLTMNSDEVVCDNEDELCGVDVITWECADAPSNNLPANVILTLSMLEVMDA